MGGGVSGPLCSERYQVCAGSRRSSRDCFVRSNTPTVGRRLTLSNPDTFFCSPSTRAAQGSSQRSGLRGREGLECATELRCCAHPSRAPAAARAAAAHPTPARACPPPAPHHPAAHPRSRAHGFATQAARASAPGHLQRLPSQIAVTGRRSKLTRVHEGEPQKRNKQVSRVARGGAGRPPPAQRCRPRHAPYTQARSRAGGTNQIIQVHTAGLGGVCLLYCTSDSRVGMTRAVFCQ